MSSISQHAIQLMTTSGTVTHSLSVGGLSTMIHAHHQSIHLQELQSLGTLYDIHMSTHPNFSSSVEGVNHFTTRITWQLFNVFDVPTLSTEHLPSLTLSQYQYHSILDTVLTPVAVAGKC